MTENAAQPGLTDDEILDAIKAGVRAARDEGLACAGPDNYVVAGALALLSKLRAEGVQAGDERFRSDVRELCAYAEGSMSVHIDTVHRVRAALASAPVAEQEFKAAFPNGVLTSARFHELWERAGKTRNGNYTLLENLTWQVGQFGDLVAQTVGAPVAGEALQVASRAMQMIRRSKLDPFERQQHDKLVQDFAALHERPVAAPQASEAVRTEALYLLREARALLPMFATAEAIGNWSEKVNRFAAGDVIDIPPQADKDGGDCAKGAGDVAMPPLPPRFSVWKDPDEDCGAWGQPDRDVFTAEQMQDYARAAVLADRQQRVAQGGNYAAGYYNGHRDAVTIESARRNAAPKEDA